LIAETILHLAEQGNVILIGRGANLVTRELQHVFHVRLVGSQGRQRTPAFSEEVFQPGTLMTRCFMTW